MGNKIWLALVVLLVVVLAVAYFTGNLPFFNQKSQAPATPPPVAGGQLGSANLGRAVGYGDWGYLVSGLERKDKLANDTKSMTPEGSFLVVHLTVTNNGKAPRSLAAADFALLDGQGRTYGVNADASQVASSALSQVNLLGSPVQPGLSRASVVVFDIPADDKGLSLRLFQGYLDVNLSQ